MSDAGVPGVRTRSIEMPDDTLRTGASPRAPWPWRAAALAATLAAGVALALVVAHWGWKLFGPASPPVPPVPAPERSAPAIAAASIFGQASSAPETPKAAPLAAGETRLLGVFAERDGSGYALFRLAGRGPALVRTGQDVAPDVRLEAVRADGVRVRDHGEVRDIVLRAPPPPATGRDRPKGAPSRAACAAPPGYQGPVYRINAELLSGIASQPESWKALLVVGEGGLAIRDNSGFSAMLGMRGGDRMTQANGIALATAEDLLAAFVKPLLASQPVRVVGTRDGKPAEWLFVNAGACPG